MMSGFQDSVQTELNTLFANIANQADLLRLVSHQAFSKSRTQFSHLAFNFLNQHLITLVTQQIPVPCWNNLLVVAADASRMPLFLKDVGHRRVREVIAFALYLPGLEMTLYHPLYDIKVGKRQMLFEHLGVKDLLVLDRGYLACWLLAHLVQRGIALGMRVDHTGFAPIKTFMH